MADYVTLKARLQEREIIRLDGAIGTQLQATGVPMDPFCWAAIGNHTHPDTAREMHEDYIRAGADIVTTNTYSAARHNYESAGSSDLARAGHRRLLRHGARPYPRARRAAPGPTGGLIHRPRAALVFFPMQGTPGPGICSLELVMSTKCAVPVRMTALSSGPFQIERLR